jgi:FAD/FMN-containing dehydrogenase
MNDTSTLFAIDGRKGIVFGSAGGIGAVLCDRIARCGAELALCDLREAAAEEGAERIVEMGGQAVGLGCDVSREDDVDRAVAENYPDFEICWFGHIGDGNLHLNILKPPALSVDAFYARCNAISPKLFELVQARGGSISAEHGVGLLKRDFLGYSRSAAEIDIMRAVKGALDPNGVMNPGKLLA